MRQSIPIYGLTMLVILLSLAIGVRYGRHHPAPLVQYFGYRFAEPGLLDRLLGD